VVVVAHWVEHLVQAYQAYALGIPRAHAVGLLGMFYPCLVHSEWLHFGYALVMLVGLLRLCLAVVGRAAPWWTAALVIQAWHLCEHTLLITQALLGRYLPGATEPTSGLQLFLPRCSTTPSSSCRWQSRWRTTRGRRSRTVA
jgi:hypothetical protein